MTTITTRSGKGSPLTNNEVDANFTNLNDDKVEASGDSMTGNLSFGDNNKAIFGAGSDLQIYHDGSNSFIGDFGTGDLFIRGSNELRFQVGDGVGGWQTAIYALDNNQVQLLYAGNTRLTTNSSGIDVTGTAVTDGVTVAGNILLQTEGNEIQFNTSSTPVNKIYSDDTYTSNGLTISADNGVALKSTNNYLLLDDTGTNEMVLNVDGGERMRVTSTGIDVTGEVEADTAHINSSSSGQTANALADDLVVETSGDTGISILSGATSDGRIFFGDSGSQYAGFIKYDHATNEFGFGTNGGATEKVTIDSSGNLDVTGTVTADGATIDGAITVNGAGINLDDAYSLTWGDGSTQVRGSGASEAIDLRTASTTRINIDADGDVSLYNSAGTSQAFFWDASTSRLGLGTTSPSTLLHVKTTGSDARIYSEASSGTMYIGQSTFSDVWSTANTSMRFATNNSERMRIDSSGNVGIGESAPDEALVVRGGLFGGSQDGGIAVQSGYASGFHIKAGFKLKSDSLGNFRAAIDTPNSTSGGTLEAISIAANTGNVGIGTASPSAKLAVAGTTKIGEGVASNTSKLMVNTASGTAAGIQLFQDSVESWIIQNPASSTALTFANSGSERMRIDSAGKLLHGTTSGPASTNVKAVFNSSGTGTYIQTSLGTTGGAIFGANSAGDLAIYTHTGAVSSETYTSRAVLKNDTGRFGLGTQSPTANLHVNSTGNTVAKISSSFSGSTTTGLYIDTVGDSSAARLLFSKSGTTRGIIGYSHNASATSEAITFGLAGGSEKMRLTGAGDLLISKTSANPADIGFQLPSTGSMTSSIQAGNTYHVYDTTNSAYRFYVSSAGQIHATSTSITAISDESLKQNIRDLDKGLDTVLALQPRRFDWKNGDGNDIMGFVAQEVEEVMPELVHDYQYTETETKLGLKMGDMVPTLVKAIQDQQEIIENLKSRIEQLEGAN